MFKNPFSFDGRIRRLEYGISFIIYYSLYLTCRAVMTPDNPLVAIMSFVFLIPAMWFFFAQGAKRCHDIGRNGWWQIIPFYFLVMIFTDGDRYENEYGFNPKYPESERRYMVSDDPFGHFTKQSVNQVDGDGIIIDSNSKPAEDDSKPTA